jgi:hypothetical protein
VIDGLLDLGVEGVISDVPGPLAAPGAHRAGR